MPLYGLIGYPLGHSFSKQYFTAKFEKEAIADCAYELFPLRTIADLPALLAAHPDLAGLNVTIPYKQAVIPYLDALDPVAQATGAVNTIRIAGGKMTGYNTDVYGFRHSLCRFLEAHNRRPVLQALVAGSGGASKAVQYVLRELGIPCLVVSREPGKGDLTYAEVGPDLMTACRLIVNTTPLGMHPDTGSAPPLPYEALTPSHLLYDLVYNPPRTAFLRAGEARGCAVTNGLEMLHLQAEQAWAVWRG